MAPLETAIRIHRAPLQNGIKMLSIVGLLLVYLGGAAALVRDLSVDWHRLSPYITCMESGEINTTCVNQLAELSELAADPTEFQNEDSFLLRSAPFSKRETRLSSCQDALAAYGSASSDFMRCAVDFSRPILLCEKCVEYYLHAQETFVAYAETKDDNGISCHDVVFGSDLIEVVNRANASVESLWGDSHCAYCFDSYYIKHGTVVYQFSQNLITFINKHQNLTNCFTAHGIEVDTRLAGVANLTNSSLVCKDCYPFYKDLTDFFLKNYTEDITKTCMDVIDVMNQTRRMWGHWFQCEDRHPSMFLVWTVAIVIFSMTIVFYVGMFFNSTFEAYIIRRQDRLETARFVAINQNSQSNSDYSYSYPPL